MTWKTMVKAERPIVAFSQIAPDLSLDAKPESRSFSSSVARWGAVAYVLTVPLETLSFGGGASIAYIPAVIMALGCALMFITGGKIRFGGYGCVTLALVGWVLLTYLWSYDLRLTTSWTRGFILTLLAGLLVAMVISDRTWLRRCLGAYALGAGAAAIAAVRQSASGTFTAALALDERATAFGQDPNAIAVIIAIAVPMVCLFLFRTKSWLARITMLGVLGVYAVAIVSTGSRTGVFALALAAALVTLTRLRRSPIQVLVAAVVLFEVVQRVVPRIAGERALARLQFSDDLNSRSEIWKAAVEPFWQRPFQGWGAGTFPTVIQPFLGVSRASHNVLVSVAIELGLVGVFLIAALIYLALRPLLRRGASPEMAALVVAVAVWVVGAATLTLTAEKVTWLVLGLAVATGKSATERLLHPSS